MTFQADYGEFDTRFLGVNLRFHASHPSTLELFEEIGTVQRDPARVIEIGEAALHDSAERAFEVFSVGTVMTHEMRHFHDFLLSPYGNALFRLRVSIMLNGFQAILPLMQQRKTVPVPIVRWLSKRDSEKAALTQMWQQLKNISTVEPFELPDDHRELINQTAKTYAKIKEFLMNPKTISATAKFQPYHLLEASAFITQIQAVYSVFGLKHVESFMNFVVNHPSASSYSTVFRLLYELWQAAQLQLDAEVMSAIVTWCLLGDYLTDGWDACPTIRFVRLYSLLRKEGPPQGKEVDELFNEWTERLSYTPIATGFKRNGVATRRFIDHLEKNSSQYPKFMQESVSNALGGLKALARANSHMAEIFQVDPKAYVNPYDYIQNSDLWPSAPQTTSFVSGGLLITKEKMEGLAKKGIFVNKAKESRDGKHVILLKLLFPKNTDGVDMIDSNLALELADQLIMTDFFFSEFRRGDPEFDVMRFVLEEDGITPLEILM